ncbi:MAG: helix-turn-helix transcriptional regulator [Candidatus Methanoplasma sp.]|jgi:DNA-binding HxlR family transcriptional regulator|nr:helix-turn-helix transcriptional regulator [Candidatus Methanoplasma sp.]
MSARNGTPKIDCALDAVMHMIGGRWKTAILCKLCTKGDLRFNQLLRELEAVSPKILTRQLRELEDDGLISREERGGAAVEYSLTELGRSLGPALAPLLEWALRNMFSNMVAFDEGVAMPGGADPAPAEVTAR